MKKKQEPTAFDIVREKYGIKSYNKAGDLTVQELVEEIDKEKTAPCSCNSKKCIECVLQPQVNIYKKALGDMTALARRYHYYNDDGWNSCPKAEGGTLNENAGTECNCGADHYNDKIEEILRSLSGKPPADVE